MTFNKKYFNTPMEKFKYLKKITQQIDSKSFTDNELGYLDEECKNAESDFKSDWYIHFKMKDDMNLNDKKIKRLFNKSLKENNLVIKNKSGPYYKPDFEVNLGFNVEDEQGNFIADLDEQRKYLDNPKCIIQEELNLGSNSHYQTHMIVDNNYPTEVSPQNHFRYEGQSIQEHKGPRQYYATGLILWKRVPHNCYHNYSEPEITNNAEEEIICLSVSGLHFWGIDGQEKCLENIDKELDESYFRNCIHKFFDLDSMWILDNYLRPTTSRYSNVETQYKKIMEVS